jgi:hypothetical protein
MMATTPSAMRAACENYRFALTEYIPATGAVNIQFDPVVTLDWVSYTCVLKLTAAIVLSAIDCP